jgi:hypothetical protein
VRLKGVLVALSVVAVLIAVLAAPACTSSGSSSPAGSPSVDGKPSEAEVTTAIRSLTDSLSPQQLAPYEAISVDKVEQDATGNWRASAHLIPAATASWWPAIIVVVKEPGGWRIVSLKADRSGGAQAPSPTQAQ